MVSAKFETTKNDQTLSKFQNSKIGPRINQKLVRACCATELDQFFLTHEMGNLTKLFGHDFCLSLLQKEEERTKTKKNKQKTWTSI